MNSKLIAQEFQKSILPPLVLIVDDNDDDAFFAVRSMEKIGCKCEVATSGENALLFLKDTMPDIVIVDLKMPGIGGLEVARYVRDHFPKVPILVCSDFYPDVMIAFKENFTVLPKPITVEQLRIISDKIGGKKNNEKDPYSNGVGTGFSNRVLDGSTAILNRRDGDKVVCEAGK